MSSAPVPASSPRGALPGSAPSSARPRTAIILAAGNGTRIRVRGHELPKPLVEVGGLALLERALLTLRAVGIERLRVVVGAYADVVEARTRARCEARGLQVEFVPCADFQRGNGASLAAGLEGVDEPFLVTMADHVFNQGYVERFLERVAAQPGLPHLATDPEPAAVFDLEDATKVRTVGGRIVAIGKELTEYDQVDTGLFYFPGRLARELRRDAAAGKASVSALVAGVLEREPFAVAPVRGEVWQDVDTPAMAREAERRLLRSLVKPSDGWVSRVLNRPVSLAVSRHLARWKVSPNAITTFVTLLTLGAAALALSTRHLYLALAGVLFHVASILDGCDGEVARLRFSGSRYGAWYDTLSDNVRYTLFYCALGVSSYRAGGGVLYIWATVLLFLVGTFFVSSMARFVWSTQEHLTNLAVTAKFEEMSAQSRNWWDRFAHALRGLIKQDVQAFAVMLLCLAGLPQVYFWLALAGATSMAISVRRAIHAHPTSAREAPSWPVFLWMLAGLAVLGFLLTRMPLEAVTESLATVGVSVLWVFATAPLWYVANALSLSALVGPRVELRHLLHNQVVGEAFNTILPLAGLGGEPYKIRHLGNWVPLSAASQAVVHDRLIHAMSGPLFTGLCLLGTLAYAPLSDVTRGSLALAALLFFAIAAVLSAVVFSRVPGRFTAAVLKRLPRVGGHDLDRISRRQLLASLAFKMLGRALSMVEIWVILRLLGLSGAPEQVMAVTALLSAGSVLLFVVPQGIGVNEASITGAFVLVGLAPHLGLTFGLIRRARLAFWAVTGLVVYLVVSVGERVRRLVADAPP